MLWIKSQGFQTDCQVLETIPCRVTSWIADRMKIYLFSAALFGHSSYMIVFYVYREKTKSHGSSSFDSQEVSFRGTWLDISFEIHVSATV